MKQNKRTSGVPGRRTALAPVLCCLIVGGVVQVLSACGGPLSTASSLRVEVEVYKGPLSLELDTQLAELFGTVEEAYDSLKLYRAGIDRFLLPLNECYPTSTYQNYRDKLNPDDISRLPVGHTGTNELHCEILNQIRADVVSLESVYEIVLDQTRPNKDGKPVIKAGEKGSEWNKAKEASYTPVSIDCQPRATLVSIPRGTACNGSDEETIRKTLTKIVEASARLKAKALHWAHAISVAAPESYVVRGTAVTFANLAGQYSNQLASRADAILKQLHGKERHLLPTSVYLRDTSITDFPKLYAWNRAAAPALLFEMAFHPLTAFSTEETDDRIRAMERLFADHYWTNINTVYASGQGTVRMALIKDDIGNWNLKSFDNDPTELLEAYKEVTLAGIDAAARAAAGVASGGGTEVTSALKLASRFAQGKFGEGSATVGGFNLEALHSRTSTRLKTLKEGIKSRSDVLAARERELNSMITGVNTEIEKQAALVAQLQGEVDASNSKIASLNQQLVTPAEEAPGTGGEDNTETPRNKADLRRELEQEQAKLAEKKVMLAEAQMKKEAKQKELALLESQAQANKAKSEKLSGTILSEARAIIEDHEVIVEVLQESVVAEQQ